MRTTVTLDTDVAVRLRQIMKMNGSSFKEAINSAVRAGLPSRSAKRKRPLSPYVLKPRDLGLRTGMLPSHLLAALEEADDLAKLRAS